MHVGLSSIDHGISSRMKLVSVIILSNLKISYFYSPSVCDPCMVHTWPMHGPCMMLNELYII